MNGLFYLQKLFFKINDLSVSAIKGVGNLIATIGPEVNGSVKLSIFTSAKGNTKTDMLQCWANCLVFSPKIKVNIRQCQPL